MDVSLITDDRLQRLENDLEKLRALYEQYFSGVHRTQPLREMEEFQRTIRNFKTPDLTSTSQKFRFTNTKAKFQQLNSLWAKTCKEIEEGKYIRDKTLSKLKSQQNESSVAGTTDKPEKSPHQQLMDKEQQALESLYEKLGQAKKGAKIVAKEKFLSLMQKQLQVFKSKNPNTSYRFRLTKDQKGQAQIKIEKKT